MTVGLVLSALMRQQGYVSGSALARQAGVSRNAVWKAVEQLRGDGYEIEAVPRRGYKLTGAPDGLRDYEIRALLETKVMGRSLHCLDQVDSTNLYAKSQARRGAAHGTLVVAEEQVAGRGRLGRVWVSEPGVSLCFSLVLRPVNVAPVDAPQLTQVAAVAVARVLRRDLGIDARLKWPNDILVDGRKICGILVEMSCELDQIHYIVLGIGINVHRFSESLYSDLEGRVASLEEFAYTSVRRASLLASVLSEFEESYHCWEKHGFDGILGEIKSLSCTLGNRVKVETPEGHVEGVAKDIDSRGALEVEESSGLTRKIYAGDVRA